MKSAWNARTGIELCFICCKIYGNKHKHSQLTAFSSRKLFDWWLNEWQQFNCTHNWYFQQSTVCNYCLFDAAQLQSLQQWFASGLHLLPNFPNHSSKIMLLLIISALLIHLIDTKKNRNSFFNSTYTYWFLFSDFIAFFFLILYVYICIYVYHLST